MLGPSGCGKTTTLRMIAGFETPTSGAIRLEGQDVSTVPPYKRDVNTVFQQYAPVPPHERVRQRRLRAAGQEGAQARGRPAGPRDARHRPAQEFAERKPAQLSGGQQQRVALARALVNYPKALLLDEPLGALDLKLRQGMQLELKRIQREVGITFIFVTHDQEEALTMSDRIAVMNVGRRRADRHAAGDLRPPGHRCSWPGSSARPTSGRSRSSSATARRRPSRSAGGTRRARRATAPALGGRRDRHVDGAARADGRRADAARPDRWTGRGHRHRARVPGPGGALRAAPARRRSVAVAHVPARRDRLPIPGDTV